MYRIFAFFFLFCSSPAPGVPFEGHKIIITGPSPIAVKVGEAVAEQGGNAVDVAVATGFALAVTSPYFASLGGGGFALVKMNEEILALDFREIAPKATGPKYYLNEKENRSSTEGGSAVGVPGVPAGLWALHQKYGKLPWKKLLAEPIRLTEKGFRVSGEWAELTRESQKKFSPQGKQYFFKSPDQPYLPGELLGQKRLGKALKLIAKDGVTPFYQGAIAKDIVLSVNENGGHMTLEDFKSYQVQWRKPLTTEFANHKIHLMPPPSSGGLIIQKALQLIEKTELKKYPPVSVDELHLLAEIMSRSFRGRHLLGDPGFHKNPTYLFTDSREIAKEFKTIDLKKTVQLPPLQAPMIKESTETTHFAVMDSAGNAVSLTVTLNGSYGSGVVSREFAIALNNEMDDFMTRPGEPNMFGLVQGAGNQVEAGKRPLSSMSPTLVEKNGKTVLALGSPGGPRIINAVLQVLYRVLVNGFDIDRAIQTPRVHHQFLPHVLFIDGQTGPFFPPETIAGLKKKKHEIKEIWIAKAYGIHLTPDGVLHGAYDSRGEGGVAGF